MLTIPDIIPDRDPVNQLDLESQMDPVPQKKPVPRLVKMYLVLYFTLELLAAMYQFHRIFEHITGPGNIGSKISISSCSKEHNHSQKEENDNSDCNWQDDKLDLKRVSDDGYEDPREKPSYDIVYQQSVTPEDIYLQIGRKTPASASCEAMILKIDMGGEAASEICCDVKRQHLDVRSPMYRLSLPLPNPVHPKICKAHWDEAASKLIVTLYLDREFDFVNF